MTSEPKWFDVNEIEKTKEEVEDEVLEAVEEAKEEEAKEEEACAAWPDGVERIEAVPVEKPKKRPPVDGNTLRTLRQLDRSFNRTCAVCNRRLPLEKFLRGKQDEVCIDCRES
jgi:hypothetical protein